MSEYYLRRYDLNQAKNSIIRIGREVGNLSNDYTRVRYSLSGQKGLGIETIRNYLGTLRNQGRLLGNDVQELGRLLNEIIRATEAADNEARKILGGFTVREQERIRRAVQEIVRYLITLILSWVGGISGEKTEVAWAKRPSDIMKVLNDGTAGKDINSIISNMLKSVSKLLAKDALVSRGISSGASSNIAKWAVDWFAHGFENFTDGDGTFSDDIRESIAEGIAGAGKVALTAGITAAIVMALPYITGAAVTAGGVAVIGAGSGIMVGFADKYASEHFFHNSEDMVENVGDIICDWMEQIPMQPAYSYR